MKEAIKRFCDDESILNGLLLIDMPTGSGKTHDVIQYIIEFLKDKKNKKRKIFFITTLKKNLDDPFGDLLKDIPDEYKNKVFRVKSNLDFVLDNWDDVVHEIEKNITDDLSKEFKRLQGKCRFIKNYGKENIEYDERDFWDAERNFRNKIYACLHKDYKKRKQKLDAIKNCEQWQWVGKLYPTVFTDEYQVFFFTVDKFLNPYATIIEPSYKLYQPKALKNTTVFIDEFDATKDTMINFIIEKGLEKYSNLIDLAVEIISGLSMNNVPKRLLEPCSDPDFDLCEYNSLEDIIERNKILANEIKDQFRLDFNYKYKGDDSKDRFFLFNDYCYSSTISKKNEEALINFNEDKRWNEILLEKTEEGEEIHPILSRIKGFIHHYARAVSLLAINYHHKRQEELSKSDEYRDYTIDAAIKTVLSDLGIKQDYINILYDIVIRLWRTRSKTKSKYFDDDFEDGDISFCNNGFSYYAFVDEDEHDNKTDILWHSFDLTPEKLLTKVCLTTKVVGISATASLPTVTGNYDMDYLRWRLHGGFYELLPEEKARLHKRFLESVKNYTDDMIQVAVTEPMSDSDYSAQNQWGKIFDNEEYAEKIHDELERLMPPKNKKSDNYDKRRYFRIAWAYKNFITEDSIHSFLCLLTAFPKDLNEKFLREIFKLITEERFGKGKYEEDSVVLLKGDNFDKDKQEILNDLSNGGKKFVISTYQTIGAGQNLQYDIPDCLRDSIVKINDFEARGQKDFDAIYLDKPTNVAVNLYGTVIPESDIIRFVFQSEYLRDNWEISEETKRKYIKDAFSSLIGKPIYSKGSLLDLKSFKVAATRTIIQAIGRICRTNMKNPKIFIYAHDEISNVLYPEIIDDDSRDFNLEFRALANAMKEIKDGAMSNKELDMLLKGSEISHLTNMQINRMLHFENWSSAAIKRWKHLRDYVMRHPTLSKEEMGASPWKAFYMQLKNKGNQIYYKTDDDFVTTELSVSPKSGFCAENEICVNIESLMMIPGLKEYFESFDYATEWIRNDYIMSPPLFNNIYKGALGEIVGKFIFEKMLGIELQELSPDVFEFFDYKVKGENVFVDFKLWTENTRIDKNSYLEKIKGKMEKCGAGKVIVVNAQLLKNSQYQSSVTAGIIQIPYLYSFEDATFKLNEEAVIFIKKAINGDFA